MANSANFDYVRDQQLGLHESIISTHFRVIAKCNKGVVLAYANVTGISELSAARVAAGSPDMAPSGQVIAVNSLVCGNVSAMVWYNEATTATSVTWVGLIS